MASELITIHRLLVPAQLAELESNTPLLESAFPGMRLEWLPPEQAGVELITRDEYMLAIQNQGSKLGRTDSVGFADRLNKVTIPLMPTEHEPIEDFALGEACFIARNGLMNYVGYLAESVQLDAEQDRLTQVVDKATGIKTYWPSFFSRLIVASIDKLNADQEVLDAFEDIKPAAVNLQPVTAVAD